MVAHPQPAGCHWVYCSQPMQFVGVPGCYAGNSEAHVLLEAQYYSSADLTRNKAPYMTTNHTYDFTFLDFCTLGMKLDLFKEKLNTSAFHGDSSFLRGDRTLEQSYAHLA